MFIPPGYANIQYLMRDSSNQRNYLTAIGVELAAADPVAVAANAAQAFWDNLGAFIGQEVDGTATRLVIGTSNPSAPIIVDNTDATGGGAATGETCPPNVAAIIRKRTAGGGRKNRGRMYIPKPTEAGVEEGGQFSSGQLAAFQTAADDFLSDLQAVDGVTGVFLFHTLEADQPTEITSLQVDPLVGTQRRRLRG